MTGTTRSVSQTWIIVCRRGSDASRTSAKIVPSRWSSSSSTRCRPMKPVAPVTKYDMGATLLAAMPPSDGHESGSTRDRQPRVRRAFTCALSAPRLGPTRVGADIPEQGDSMRTRTLMAAFAGAALCTVAAVAGAAPGIAAPGHSNRTFTMAVYGDAPYGTTPTDTSETDATPAFIDAVNADPDVSTVHPRRRHPLRQAVLHRGLRPHDRRALEPLRRPDGLHAGRQRVDRLPQGGEGGGTYNAGHRPDRLRHGRRRQPRRLRRRQPGRQPRPGPLDLLPDARAAPSAAAPSTTVSQATVVRPGAPAGRAVRRERDAGSEKGVRVRHAQHPGRLEQRRRPLVRRAHAPRRSSQEMAQAHRRRPALARPGVPDRRR